MDVGEHASLEGMGFVIFSNNPSCLFLILRFASERVNWKHSLADTNMCVDEYSLVTTVLELIVNWF